MDDSVYRRCNQSSGSWKEESKMKGWAKGMLVASAICIGTGAIMCITAWAMGGRFSYYRHRGFGFVEDQRDIVIEEDSLGEENRTEKVFSGELISEGKAIRNLEIEVTAGKVELIADDSVEEIEVLLNNANYQFHQNTEKDKIELYIGLKDNFWDTDFEFFEDQAAQIRIPTGFEFQKVKLELKAGLLDVEGIIAKEMEIELKAGQMTVTNANIEQLNSECAAGELIYQGDIGEQLDVECKTGRAEYLLSGKEKDFNYELEVLGGRIVIDGEIMEKLSQEATINNPEAMKKAELECKAGEICIEFE